MCCCHGHVIVTLSGLWIVLTRLHRVNTTTVKSITIKAEMMFTARSTWVELSFAAEHYKCIEAHKCTGVPHENRTMFTRGKTSCQQLHQCGNDVSSYSGRVTKLIQFIFCIYRVVCGRMESNCVFVPIVCVYVRVCGCVSVCECECVGV